MMSLMSFLELEIIGEVHGAEEGLEYDAKACFCFRAFDLNSDGDCASSGSCGEDIWFFKKLRSPKDSASGTLAPKAGESG